MNKAQADKIAKGLIRRRVPAFCSIYTASSLFNDHVLFTEAAWKKVQVAFLRRVIQDPQYPVFERMWAEDKIVEVDQ